MLRRRFLRYGQLWTEFLKPWFPKEPSIPSKEALAYHALLQAASDRSARKIRNQAKGSFRKFTSEKAGELYRSWSRTEGELGYEVEEAVGIALKAVEEGWMKAFPPSGPPATPDTQVELKRKFLSVDHELAARLARAAKEMGVKVTALTRDAVEQKLAAIKLGVTLRQTLDFYETVKLCSSYGLSLVPLEPLNRALERLKAGEFESVAEGYRSNGASLGAYLQTLGEDEAVKLLRRIFETGIFKVTSLDLSRRGVFLDVKCVASPITDKNTKLLTAFLEGFVEGFGFKLTSRESTRGIISLKASLTSK